MSRNNLFKFGVAAAAAGVGAILAITSVFAHSSPTASGHSIVGSIVKAEVAAGFPLVNFDAAPNTVIDEQAADAEEAAELAAAIAAQQAEQAAEQAAQAAELAKEQAAQAAEQQNADADDQQEGDVENQAGNSDQGNDQAGNSDQGGD
jgi:phosphate/sulfate permease